MICSMQITVLDIQNLMKRTQRDAIKESKFNLDSKSYENLDSRNEEFRFIQKTSSFNQLILIARLKLSINTDRLTKQEYNEFGLKNTSISECIVYEPFISKYSHFSENKIVSCIKEVCNQKKTFEELEFSMIY